MLSRVTWIAAFMVVSLGSPALADDPASTRAAAGPEVVEVRVGNHPTFTRVVFELDAPAGYRVERRSAEDGTAELLVTLEAGSTPRSVTKRTVMVERVAVQHGTDRSAAHIRLKKTPSRVKELILANPPRIVFDLILPEKELAALRAREEAKAKAAAEAKQAAAVPAPKPVAEKPAPAPKPVAQPVPPPTPVAQPEPKPAPAPKPVVKRAPPPTPVAKPEPKPAPAPKPVVKPAPTPKPVVKPAPTPKPVAEPKPAPKPVAKPEPTPAARPVPVARVPVAEKPEPTAAAKPEPTAAAKPEPRPGATPEPSRMPPAAKPSPAPEKPEPTVARPARRPVTPPPAPSAAEPASSGGFDARLWLMLAGGLLVLLLAFVLIARRRSLPNDLDVTALAEEDAEGAAAIPEAGFAMGPSQGVAGGPDFGTPVDTTQAPEFGAGPGLFDDESEKENETMDTESQDLPIEHTQSELPTQVGAAAVGAAQGDVTRLVRDLERRMAQLETRLDEQVDARERLERQVAAQAEELRVQRAAIARTQRALRSLNRGEEEQATEPALRDPSKPSSSA